MKCFRKQTNILLKLGVRYLGTLSLYECLRDMKPHKLRKTFLWKKAETYS